MNKRVAIILINYKDYAKKYLAECFDSLARQDYSGEMKIFIVDNETSDESYNFIKQTTETQPETRRSASLQTEIIRNQNNDGFAKGNNDAIKLALAQGFEYIVLFNMDTIIEVNCLTKMVETVEEADKKILDPGSTAAMTQKNIGAVQARIMMWPEKDKVNSLGNVTHFLGFGYCDSYGEKYSNLSLRVPTPRDEAIYNSFQDKQSIKDRHGWRPRDDKIICYPSGAAVLFTRAALEKVGLFDEEFWMYNEDQDLGWRLWLAGYQCVLAPEAIVYHKYEFSRSASKYYWLDRNRILSIWKNYHFTTLLLILPAFIIMEFGLILFSFKSGWFKEKFKVWAYFFNPLHWPYLRSARRTAQALRKIKDCDIISMFSGKIWYQEIDDVKLRLINPAFNAYWHIVKKIIWW